jgi:hypothetical protein
VAVPGDHGIAPEIVRALKPVAPTSKNAAVEPSSDLRDNLASKPWFGIRFFLVDVPHQALWSGREFDNENIAGTIYDRFFGRLEPW